MQLEYAPRGRRFRVVARTTAAAGGAFRFALRPRRSGYYRAVVPGGASAARRLTVVARLAGRACPSRSRRLPDARARSARPRLWRTDGATPAAHGGRLGHGGPRTHGSGRAVPCGVEDEPRGSIPAARPLRRRPPQCGRQPHARPAGPRLQGRLRPAGTGPAYTETVSPAAACWAPARSAWRTSRCRAARA